MPSRGFVVKSCLHFLVLADFDSNIIQRREYFCVRYTYFQQIINLWKMLERFLNQCSIDQGYYLNFLLQSEFIETQKWLNDLKELLNSHCPS